ncbi:hypothetical protein BH23CHL2_BH23CHL2_27730 [soil metagenome]
MVEIYAVPAEADPYDPCAYGPLVTSGAVNPAGSFTASNLLGGDYVVCADGAGSVSPSCEVVAVFNDAQTIVNNVDLSATIMAAITGFGINEVQSYNDFDSFGWVDGGTYTISFTGSTTAVLQWDADAATVEAALNGLASIGGIGGTSPSLVVLPDSTECHMDRQWRSRSVERWPRPTCLPARSTVAT